MTLSIEMIELITEIIDTLRLRNQTLSTAESITAGAVSGHDVGSIWLAIEGPVTHSIELSLSGERDSVRNAATASAIAAFARILRSSS